MSDTTKNSPNDAANDAAKKQSEDDQVLSDQVREIEAQKLEQADVRATERAAKDLDRENTAKLLGEKLEYTPVMTDDEARRKMWKHSRRDFLIGGAAAVFGYLGYGWLRQPENAGWAFNESFKLNEAVSQSFYSPARLAPEFPLSRVGQLRVNGGEGMSEGFDAANWRLQIVGLDNPRQHSQFAENIAYQTAMDNSSEMRDTGQQHEQQDAKQKPDANEMPPETLDRAAASQMPMPGLLLTLDDIKALPRVEMTTELKCIEGWSTIVNWTGARFSDFLSKFPAPSNTEYVSLVTPDGGYYVGMDMPSMLHPQTLLCYEMNGALLPMQHGAPLRLMTATKYGIKQIKRIGRIAFTNERPADFWAERGYDWYSGH